MSDGEDLKKTPLFDLHNALGGRMVPFAGYAMPVQYPAGIVAEHEQTRNSAGLFDVSHMGQVVLRGAGVVAALERLVPGDIGGLAPGRMRYTQFTNDTGGILDDLMVTRLGEDELLVVVNAACKAQDLEILRAGMEGVAVPEVLEDKALLALQGPKAADVLAGLDPRCRDLAFMSGAGLELDGTTCFVTRSGYTGEDGYEISVAGNAAASLAARLLEAPEAGPVGLGARDSLRLEAGLCLYGHDIDTTTSPVEAALAWSIGKRRREEGGFPGAGTILGQLADGVARRRVGILPEGRAPAREHTTITDADGAEIGAITSGGFGPTVGGPVAMGYVARPQAAAGTAVNLMVREKPRPAQVAKMPFVEPGYHRG